MAYKQVFQDRLNEAKDCPVKQKGSKSRRNAAEEKENKSTAGTKTHQVEKKEEKKKGPAIQWAKPSMHHYTNTLLMIIEDCPHYRQAFGFSKETATAVMTGGQTVVDLYIEVASKLFVQPENATFTSDDLPDLQKVVSNHVTNLKKSYHDYHKKLGEMGQGLVEEDRKDKITDNTPLANLWDSIKSKFPWYMHMHRLYGSNPIVNHSVLAHSQTTVDMKVLGTHVNRHASSAVLKSDTEESDVTKDGTSLSNDNDDHDEKSSDVEKPSSPLALRHHGKPVDLPSSLPLPAAHCRKSAIRNEQNSTPTSSDTSSAVTRIPAKRRNYLDQISEITDQDRAQKIKIIEIKHREKTKRSRAKAETRHDIKME
ncbi:hypothetical protein BJ912DRAFT_936052 [Pholiota molesta]|nr:hypothetical protein BJ912DRAFT_936052 [Pholiota molesta]